MDKKTASRSGGIVVVPAERVIDALATLGEDPSTERVEDVQRHLAEQQFPVNSPSEVLLCAVIDVREKIAAIKAAPLDPASKVDGFAVAARWNKVADWSLVSFHKTQSEAEHAMAVSKEERTLVAVLPAEAYFGESGNVRMWKSLGGPTAERKEDAVLEEYIKISADSIVDLRKSDVFRVLEAVAADNIDGVKRVELASFIARKRPEFAEEVDDVMEEAFPGEGWGSAVMSAPSEAAHVEHGVNQADSMWATPQERSQPEPLTIAYLAMGARQALLDLGQHGAVDLDAFNGEIDFIDQVIAHAKFVDHVADWFDENGEHPGAFSYEVVQPMGAAIASQMIGRGEPVSAPGELLGPILQWAHYDATHVGYAIGFAERESDFRIDTPAEPRVIRLNAFDITVTVTPEGSGRIESSLHDESESSEAKAALDGVESMILAHAVAGIDVNSPRYLEGIETAVEAVWNQHGDEHAVEQRGSSPSPGM